MSDNTQNRQSGQASDPIMPDAQSLEPGQHRESGIPASAGISPGTLLCKRFEVVSSLGSGSGEADLYLCVAGESRFVGKVYKAPGAISPEAARALLSVDDPYVVPVVEFGSYLGFQVEVSPYYRHGSLAKKRFSYEELRNRVIPEINQALNALHGAGILHRNLKPANIMLQDNAKDIVIANAALGMMTDDGSGEEGGQIPQDVHEAPEASRDGFLLESDYYAFGMTIYELFAGRLPFEEMDGEEARQYITLQRLPFPTDMPLDLRLLISALTYPDVAHRLDKSNPHRRWTYREVLNWCEGKTQHLPGTGSDPDAALDSPLPMFGEQLRTGGELVSSLCRHWEEGKKLVFGGNLSAHLRTMGSQLAVFCADAEKEAALSKLSDDYIYWKLMFKFQPGFSGFCWKGMNHQNLPALGHSMLESLWAMDERHFAAWDSMLQEKVLSSYLIMTKGGHPDLMKAVQTLEAAHQPVELGRRASVVNYYLLAYLLSENTVLLINGQQIRGVREFSAYLKKTLDESFEDFKGLCHSLINYDNELDSQLEAWLISLGKRDELATWQAVLYT